MIMLNVELHLYNRLLTKEEEQLQFPLQIVSEHRRVYPDTRKKILCQPRQ